MEIENSRSKRANAVIPSAPLRYSNRTGLHKLSVHLLEDIGLCEAQINKPRLRYQERVDLYSQSKRT